MIIQRTATYPGMRAGILCSGTCSASSGVATITVKGKDYSSKITGISLIPLVNSTTVGHITHVVSIAYSAVTKLTTITIHVFSLTTGTVYTALGSPSIPVHYSFWLETNTLPSDTSTNDTTKQEYA